MDLHTATITQTGDFNDADIQQLCSGSYPGGVSNVIQTGDNNEAYQTFGYQGTDYSSKLAATQTGLTNYAWSSVIQTGDFNSTTITQDP